MTRFAAALPITALLALAACDKSSDPGTSITFDATSKEGNAVKASSDGATGAVSVDVPGFKANIDLPKIRLDASNFDMNGAKLYPESKITNLAIKGKEGGSGRDEGGVEVSFTAPANLDTVKGWFAKEWAARSGVTVKQEANGISGTDAEGGNYRLLLDDAGGNATKGRLTIQGRS